jgi:O-antigen ligase
MAIIATFTRAPMIGAGAGIIFFLWLTRSPLLRLTRVFWFTVVLGALLLVLLPRLEGTSTFQQGIVRPGNLTGRENYWAIALPIVTESPHNFVFGIGTAALETPSLSTDAPIPPDVAIRPQTFEDSLHSQYVTTMVEQGAVGLAATVLLLLSGLLPAARVARVDRDPGSAAIAGGILVVAIVMSVDTVFLDPAIFSFLMLGTGLAASIATQSSAARTPLQAQARVSHAWHSA